MPIEQPKKYSEDEVRKIEMNKRVEKLKDNESDNPWESPICDLAKKEDEVRKEKEVNLKGLRRIFKNRKLSSKEKSIVDKEADLFSDETLEKMEAQKESTKAKLEKMEAQKRAEKAEVESVTDSLTGLKNRRGLDEEMSRELRMLQRQTREEERRIKMDCSFLIIDLDDFKIINDKFGHLEGDNVLIKLANGIKDAARAEDSACRWGGDEFAIFLPHTNMEGAKIIAERLIKKINETEIITDKNEKIKFNISIGGASVADIENWRSKDVKLLMEELENNADSVLYKSKKSGKNMVSFYNKIEKNSNL